MEAFADRYLGFTLDELLSFLLHPCHCLLSELNRLTFGLQLRELFIEALPQLPFSDIRGDGWALCARTRFLTVSGRLVLVAHGVWAVHAVVYVHGRLLEFSLRLLVQLVYEVIPLLLLGVSGHLVRVRLWLSRFPTV